MAIHRPTPTTHPRTLEPISQSPKPQALNPGFRNPEPGTLNPKSRVHRSQKPLNLSLGFGVQEPQAENFMAGLPGNGAAVRVPRPLRPAARDEALLITLLTKSPDPPGMFSSTKYCTLHHRLVDGNFL